MLLCFVESQLKEMKEEREKERNEERKKERWRTLGVTISKALTTDCVGLEAAEVMGVIVMLLVILLGVVFPDEGWRGERSTVPVGISLLSGLRLRGLSINKGLLHPSEGLLNCGPRWMCILLSSVVMMLLLPLYFLTVGDPSCFSGVILITVRPVVIS